MAFEVRRQIFLTIFLLTTLLQVVLQWYFASVFLTIEHIYQIRSLTIAMLMIGLESGQIVGYLTAIHLGRSRCERRRLLLSCLLVATFGAVIATSPHFLINGQTRYFEPLDSNNLFEFDFNETHSQISSSQLNHTVSTNVIAAGNTTTELQSFRLHQLCSDINQSEAISEKIELERSPTNPDNNENESASDLSLPLIGALVIKSLGLLAIGFGSACVNLLGANLSEELTNGKQAAPSYANLWQAARALGAPLGACLGAVCLQLQLNGMQTLTWGATLYPVGTWWLGALLVGGLQALLALPMFYFGSLSGCKTCDELEPMEEEQEMPEAETYRAAEDHDIGSSRDLAPYLLTMDPNTLDRLGQVAASQEALARGQLQSSHELMYSSRERLQSNGNCQAPASNSQNWFSCNFGKNLILSQLGSSKGELTWTIQQPQAQQVIRQLPAGALDQAELHSTSSYNTTSAHTNHTSYTSHNNPPLTTQLSLGGVGGPRDSYVTMRVPNRAGSSSASLSFTEAFALDSELSLRSKSSSSTSIVDTPPPPSSSDEEERRSMQALTSEWPLTSMWRILSNKLLLLRLLSSTLKHLAISGFLLFMPKYLAEQFQLQASQASLSLGLAALLCLAIGLLGGNFLVCRFQVGARFMAKWLACSSFVAIIVLLLLMQLSCPQNQIKIVAEDSECCQCKPQIFEPVCLLQEQKTFASACLAGCKRQLDLPDSQTGRKQFQSCSCTSLPTSNQSSTDLIDASPIALSGRCKTTSCDKLIWYLIGLGLFAITYSSSELGGKLLSLRCVSTRDQSIALAATGLSGSLFAAIPSYFMYAFLFDSSCLSWFKLRNIQTGSPSNGACLANDSDALRVRFHLLGSSLMAAALIADLLILRRTLAEPDFCLERVSGGSSGASDQQTSSRIAITSRALKIESKANTIGLGRSSENI